MCRIAASASLILLFGCVHQERRPTLAPEGDRLFFAGDFAGSLEKYRQAWTQGDQSYTVPYGAACAASRAGKVDEALLWVDRAIERGVVVATLALDSDLA